MSRIRITPILILVAIVAPAFSQKPEYPASKHGGTYMFSYYLPQTPTATPWWPAWSPDGKWNGDEVSVTRDHSADKNRLYFGEWDMATQPMWMPNGKELVFVSNRNVTFGSGDVLRTPAEPDGILKAKTVLHEQTLYRTRPDVSPDGKRIIYSSSGGAADERNHLYVLPVAGGEAYKMSFGTFDD